VVPDGSGDGKGAEAAEAAALWACAGSIVDQAKVKAMNIKKERVIRIPRDGGSNCRNAKTRAVANTCRATGRGLARKHPL
jgi:outer membrane lipoprotein SlyB